MCLSGLFTKGCGLYAGASRRNDLIMLVPFALCCPLLGISEITVPWTFRRASVVRIS